MAHVEVCAIAKLEDLSLSPRRMKRALSLYNNALYWRNEEAPSTCDAEGLGRSCPT